MVTLDFEIWKEFWIPASAPRGWRAKRHPLLPFYTPWLRKTVLTPPPPFDSCVMVNATPLALIPPPLCSPRLWWIHETQTQVTMAVWDQPLVMR